MKILRNILSAAALALAVSASAADAPRYIFYFIGDGMGMGPVMATEAYSRLVLGNDSLNGQLTMTTFPAASIVTTFSASSPVTDSAAAGTALATGYKTRNGMVGMDADTVAVNSIARFLKDAGWGVGLVTDCAADDATPAAFYAHQPNRAMFYEIDKDAAVSGYDFIAGAGLQGGKDKTGQATDMYDILASQGYTVLRGQEGARAVATTDSRKIILLNPEGYGSPAEMGFYIDSVGKDGVGLTLPIAMEACLTQLQRNSPDRFFMMVENGLIDHALHGNDGSAAVKQVLGLDDCIRRAYEFYLQHPDETLIVITADHDTGGMSVGCKSTGYNALPQYVDCQKVSKGVLSDEIESMLRSRRRYEWSDIRDYLSEKLGLFTVIPVSDEVTEELQESFEKTFHQGKRDKEKGLYKTSNAFAAKVMRVYSNATGWGFTTPNHSGNPVPVYAIGVGSQHFTRHIDNTQIPKILRQLTR